MNQHHLTTSDYFAAVAPAGGGMIAVLADANVVVVFLSGLTGLAYLIWKWRKEAKRLADK